nr:RNA-binding protein 33-like [Halyomorpha halys]
MADSNDDLLEDGDLSETNFEELDLAEEDALLADDGDDLKPIKSSRNEGEKMSQEDDDYLELGVDEDLTLNDEEVIENGNNKKKRIPIAFHDNDDSDDNSGGERTRFKSERQIIARSSSAIPETLDAVAVRNPIKVSRGGNRGGKGRGGSGKKYGRFQSTNIHVNPHFRPRIPVGGPQMWNSGYHGPPQPPSFQPSHPNYGYQPSHVQQTNQWNDQGYYVNQGPPQYNQTPMDMNNYYNPGQEQFYPPQPPPGGYPPQPIPPQPSQASWDPNYYQGGPSQNFGPPGGFQHGPQMMPPRMRQPYNPGPRPAFNKNQNKHFVAKHHHQGGQQLGWSNNRHQKRDQFHHLGKMSQNKQQKFDNSSAHRVRSNLQEIKMVDCLPAEALAVEEDEEMKAYRKKIEEQKKLREQILKQKEEKRMVAAQQKQQESGSASTTVAVTSPTSVSADGPPGVSDDSAKKVEYKTVRLRTSDGKTRFKKMTVAEIKELKKMKKFTKKVSPLHKINPSGVSVKAPLPQVSDIVVKVI